MRKTIRELNCKQWRSGNMDYWWYNISSPSKLNSQDRIRLNLWNPENRELIKRVVLDLKKNWLSRIQKASKHIYRDLEICKVYIRRKHGSNEFFIYFGRLEDGIYPLP